MSIFWRNLDIPLFNCEVSFILNWSTNCVIFSNARRDAIAATELSAANVSSVKPAVIVSATNATFKITNVFDVYILYILMYKIVCPGCYLIN